MTAAVLYNEGEVSGLSKECMEMDSNQKQEAESGAHVHLIRFSYRTTKGSGGSNEGFLGRAQRIVILRTAAAHESCSIAWIMRGSPLLRSYPQQMMEWPSINSIFGNMR